MYTIIQIEEMIKEKMLQTMEVGILIIMFKTLHGLEDILNFETMPPQRQVISILLSIHY